eukprot:TRINITY_DN24514_c0_g1_i1.p1 TRINITY_DN24514_c0_g1~~TRINITY_DN24514_c0_g1_i1.p1  ORF type:complete len:220 (-),score=57.74 TRINITY_DN24514_c0_g1_i1:80-739(-)
MCTSAVVVLILNTCFLLAGMITAFAGFWEWFYRDGVTELEVTFEYVPVLLMAGGAVVVVAAILAHYGTILRKKFIFYAYFVVVLVAVCGDVSLSVWGLLRGLPVIEGSLADAWANATDSSRWAVEIKYGCCGFYNISDNPFNCSAQWDTGCQHSLVSNVSDVGITMASLALAFAAAQVVCLICPCCFCKKKTKSSCYKKTSEVSVPLVPQKPSIQSSRV